MTCEVLLEIFKDTCSQGILADISQIWE